MRVTARGQLLAEQLCCGNTLQVFLSSKTYNALPQKNVSLKVVRSLCYVKDSL